jgi:hypothetical protein
MSSEGGSILLLPLKIFLIALDVLVREEKETPSARSMPPHPPAFLCISLFSDSLSFAIARVYKNNNNNKPPRSCPSSRSGGWAC